MAWPSFLFFFSLRPPHIARVWLRGRFFWFACVGSISQVWIDVFFPLTRIPTFTPHGQSHSSAQRVRLRYPCRNHRLDSCPPEFRTVSPNIILLLLPCVCAPRITRSVDVLMTCFRDLITVTRCDLEQWRHTTFSQHITVWSFTSQLLLCWRFFCFFPHLQTHVHLCPSLPFPVPPFVSSQPIRLGKVQLLPAPFKFPVWHKNESAPPTRSSTGMFFPPSATC